MKDTLENAIFFMVKTYLDSGILTPQEAMNAVENARTKVLQHWKQELGSA
jgi:hypothetical protein